MGIKDAPAFLQQGVHPATSYGLFLTHFHATVDRGDKGLKSWSPLPLVDGEACLMSQYCLGFLPWAVEQLDHVQWMKSISFDN